MTDGSINAANAPTRSEVDQSSVSARAFEATTRSLFKEAGLRPGMRVLDFCSGAGDVAFLVRDLVGSEGQVIGIDETPGTVALAKERAAFRGLSNVDFVASKVDALPFEREFDAVVGRVVLMYRKNPVSDVRNLLRYLKPGCLCVFQEMDLTSGKTMPPAPVIDQVRSWILRAFAQAQIELEMGTKLFSVFKDSGLEEPQMRIDGLIGGCRSAGPAVIANIARILLPQITGLGIASAETVQIDTLESRIRADLERSGSVMSLPLLIGAWARPPA